jgi:hypothetical protein
MATKEKLFAQFTLMNYLQGSHGDRTVQEILEHVRDNTAWGRAQLERGGPTDLGLRNVQNWLKDIRESAEFGQQIEWQEDPNNRRQYRYRSRGPVIGKRIMPVEEACTLLMAEKFLDAALPADFYDASLQDLFRTAREVLSSYDKRPKHARKQVKGYLKRVAIEQRGQTLVEHGVPYDVLGVISRAILDGKCVNLSYWGEARIVHPYAIVLKSPKIYLLAVDDHIMGRRRPADLIPTQFLCARITDASVSKRANRAPEDFDADKFIAQVGLDVESHDESGLPATGFKLKLRIIDAASDNLLQDLKEFPLSKSQVLEKEQGTDNYILSAPGTRATHQLTEWIIGRLDRVEVLAPLKLRNYIAARIAAMHSLYT